MRWLTPAEKAWVQHELASDAARLGEPTTHGVLAALRHPLVLRLGAFGFLTIGAFITFTLSAPLLLEQGTGFGATTVGWIVSLGGVLGAIGMLIGGWNSDLRGSGSRRCW